MLQTQSQSHRERAGPESQNQSEPVREAEQLAKCEESAGEQQPMLILKERTPRHLYAVTHQIYLLKKVLLSRHPWCWL